MKAEVRRGSWVVTVPLVAVLVGYFVLVYLPTRRAIAELREQIEQQQNTITEAAVVSSSLKVAKDQLQQAEDYLEVWRQTAPAAEDIPALQGEFNSLATDAGTAVTRFDPQKPVRHAKLQQFPLGIGCSGSLLEVYDFLRSLEELPATIWIDDLSLEKMDQEAEDIECELTLVTFVDNPENSD